MAWENLRVSVRLATPGPCAMKVHFYKYIGHLARSDLFVSKLIVEIDECVSGPCQHGGTCSDKVDAFECDCVSGYVGKQCETGRMGWMRSSLARVFPETCVYPLDIDDCSTVPCLNNATCIDAVDDYSCSCVSGYTGEVCETGECLLTLTIVSVSCQSVLLTLARYRRVRTRSV